MTEANAAIRVMLVDDEPLPEPPVLLRLAMGGLMSVLTWFLLILAIGVLGYAIFRHRTRD